MTVENHCRIGRVKMKKGADLYILEDKRSKSVTSRYGDGTITFRADRGDIRIDHALYLLECERYSLMREVFGEKK